jgi:ubiquinone/menaquinone biosynthesis C-methylase UbiE
VTDYQHIYNERGADYDRLVSREDYEGNLLRTIRQIRPLSQLAVVETGAGTGRITAMLAPHVRKIHAFDASAHMLAFATPKLANIPGAVWETAVTDHRSIPLAENTTDLFIAGWSLGHLPSWYPDNWQNEIDAILTEMRRMTRTGGTILIIETLGTGREIPKPPTLRLETYYRWLETIHGFNTTWIRTDYAFASVAEAAELTRFFFGDPLADDILQQQTNILPECTGIWWVTNS